MTKKLFVLLLTLSPLAIAQLKNAALPLPDSGNVSLPLDEYNRLVELASKTPKRPEPPPINYSVKHADLKLRVENESVSGAVQLDGEVFRKGMSRVALTTGMTILDVREQGKGVPFSPENGAEVAILSGPAEFSVSVNVALPLQVEAGKASF